MCDSCDLSYICKWWCMILMCGYMTVLTTKAHEVPELQPTSHVITVISHWIGKFGKFKYKCLWLSALLLGEFRENIPSQLVCRKYATWRPIIDWWVAKCPWTWMGAMREPYMHQFMNLLFIAAAPYDCSITILYWESPHVSTVLECNFSWLLLEVAEINQISKSGNFKILFFL